jgi:hypothetical protein
MHCRRDHGSTGATLAVPFTPKINAEPKNEHANDGECNWSKSDIGGMRTFSRFETLHYAMRRRNPLANSQ